MNLNFSSNHLQEKSLFIENYSSFDEIIKVVRFEFANWLCCKEPFFNITKNDYMMPPGPQLDNGVVK